MSKINLITSGKIDWIGAKKIWKSFLISVVGAGIIGIGDLVNVIDLGSWQPILIAFVPFVVNFLRKWLGTYESK